MESLLPPTLVCEDSWASRISCLPPRHNPETRPIWGWQWSWTQDCHMVVDPPGRLRSSRTCEYVLAGYKLMHNTAASRNGAVLLSWGRCALIFFDPIPSLFGLKWAFIMANCLPFKARGCIFQTGSFYLVTEQGSIWLRRLVIMLSVVFATIDADEVVRWFGMHEVYLLYMRIRPVYSE